FEWTHKRMTGEEFPASVLLTRVEGKEEGVLQATVRDISVQKKVEKAMVETVKLKTDFTSMVSHELRTPLTSIREGVAIVLDGSAGEINEEQAEFLGAAKRNVDRLARLINDVLDFSKLEAGKMPLRMKASDIKETVKEVVSAQQVNARGKQIDLTMSVEGDIPEIKFDKDRIIQVVANLISNALKFTPREGNVNVWLFMRETAVCVSVNDTGLGIKEDDVPKLFQEFRQLDNKDERKTGGTGLGLAISKKIIKQHGGDIWVESELGKGSKFMFSLPVERKQKILVVDDEKEIRDLYRKLLERAGYVVLEAGSGMDGIMKAQEEDPELIILDMRLPDITGYEVIGRLRSESDTLAIPVLAVSGYEEALAELDKLESSLESSAIPRMNKPFDNEVFVSMVKSMLRRLE
ncbi:MAG: ATP-binding protein, partial [Candidatus Tantalella remota]|nr:ATP-binding protein [Candidatus Tantalella remota]